MTRETGEHSGACQRSAALGPVDFVALERAADARDLASFLKTVKVVSWTKRSAPELAKAIQYALSLGAFAVAQQLAQVGAREHGEDPRS
jgi:hypothetical protein